MPQELELTSVSAGYVRSRVREVMMVAMGCGMGILAWAVARKGGMNVSFCMYVCMRMRSCVRA